MNKLLILGAGGHGKVIAEIAMDIGYEYIAFLDDNATEAIGKISELNQFKSQYEEAFVGVGSNKLRYAMLSELRHHGYIVPTLIHPSAYVSRTASVGSGTVIEPKAIVNANSHIGMGGIISIGAIVDHDVEVGECCHINTGAVVKAGGKIEDFRKLEAGEIVLGYDGAIVR